MVSWSISRPRKECGHIELSVVPVMYMKWTNSYGEVRLSYPDDRHTDELAAAAALPLSDSRYCRNYTVSWFCRAVSNKAGFPYPEGTLLFVRREIRLGLSWLMRSGQIRR